jgi:hypothetical protein
MNIQIDLEQIAEEIKKKAKERALEMATRYLQRQRWGDEAPGEAMINKMIVDSFQSIQLELSQQIEEIQRKYIKDNLERITIEATQKAMVKRAEHLANKAVFAAIDEQAPR